MGEGVVRVERRGAAAVVWLDNPARRNALTRTMLGELFTALHDLDADPQIGCIVLRGAGGTFCSGLDLTSLGRDAGMLDLATRLEEVLAGVRTLSIAVVEGHAIGAGVQIALGCTLRLAAPGATFAIPVGRLALVYPPLSIQRLVEQVGAARATLMLATGRRIDARTACAWGLVTDLVGARDDCSLDADLATTLAEIEAGSRLSLEASLAMVRAVADDPRADAMSPAALHQHWSALSASTGEHEEALRARAERRPAVFSWRPAP